ncbi:MAG: hypothetical protein GQ578_10895 [Desulfuromonadaceae bacterium]|nr:hypothetical protein [Desulfuromonadaceae bacterium]
MTRQDDPFDNDPAIEETEEALPSERLKADPSVEISSQESSAGAVDVGGGGIAEGEVRVVESPSKSGSSKLPLGVILLLVALVTAGYFLFNTTGEVQQAESSLQRRPIPARPALDKQVKEELIDQQQIAVAEKRQIANPLDSPSEKAAAKGTEVKKMPLAVEKSASEPGILYRVMVGPYLRKDALGKAQEKLRELGFEAQQTRGSGMVSMIRLLEGTYSATVAHNRLRQVKKVTGDAFLLPSGDKLALYVGSFHDQKRAAGHADELAGKGIHVHPVKGEVEMQGHMLMALQADYQTALQVAERIGNAGLTTQVVRR